MLFIYRLIRFLPASKNIQIIIGTVIDEIRNGGAFFGVLFVSATFMDRYVSSINRLSFSVEFLLCLFHHWYGTLPWCNGTPVRDLQSIKYNVSERDRESSNRRHPRFLEFVARMNSWNTGRTDLTIYS